MECLHCGKKLGVFRKWSDPEFCSAAHRKTHKKKQQDEALEYLLRHKPGAKSGHQPESKPQLEPATPQKPDPEAAGFIQPVNRFRSPPALLLRHGEALRLPTMAVLPRNSDTMLPGAIEPCSCRRQNTVVPSRMEFGGTSHRDAVAFPTGPPERGRYSAPMRAVWIEPARQAESQPELAAFAGLAPRLTKIAGELKRDSGDCRNSFVPSFATFRVQARTPALRTAASSAATPSGAWTLRTPPLDRPRAVRHAEPLCAEAPPSFPANSIILQRRWLDPAPGATLSVPGPAAGAFKRGIAEPAGVSSVSVIEAIPLVSDFQPQVPGCTIILRQPRLDPAARLSLEPSKWTHIAPPAAKRETAAFIGTLWIHLDTRKRLAVIPPRPPKPAQQNEEISLLPPVTAATRRQRRPLMEIWRLAPSWQRRLAIALPLAAIGLFGGPRLGSLGPTMKLRDAIQARVVSRAAIDLEDDFRSGLSHWTGAPGWAKTWSYDPTGFVRPGRMALLDGSQALTSYRLEFTAQIEKRAVGWVFRAKDERNYYAAKLVESKNGAASIFTILRYAVIDGRESLRVQLPLPAVPTAKSLYRVRQEVQGTQFTTYLDGRLIDTWNDGTFERGGAGFFADPAELAYVRWVEVTHQDDSVGRICSYLSKAIGR